MGLFKKNSMNKSILVLGASGLLGQSVVSYLKESNYIIGALSRDPIINTSNQVKTHNVDILDYGLLEKIIQQYDVILNCTGQITDPINSCLLLNTQGITNIINAIGKHKKMLIHISSVSVYGTAKYVNEDSKLNPETPYATLKCISEYLIQQRLENYVILRVSNLFGNNQKKGIINYMTSSYLKSIPNLQFNNNGDLKRYYLNIDDLSTIIREIIEKTFLGVYNLTGNKSYNIKELVQIFQNTLDYSFNVTYANSSALENIDYIDNSKIKNIYKSRFKVDIVQYIKGLKQ